MIYIYILTESEWRKVSGLYVCECVCVFWGVACVAKEKEEREREREREVKRKLREGKRISLTFIEDR